jgi:hypothetical protein
MNANFIHIPTAGLFGLALKNITSLGEVLYVSVYSGIAPGVYTYNALTGQLIKGRPFRIVVRRPLPKGFLVVFCRILGWFLTNVESTGCSIPFHGKAASYI